MPVSFEFTVPQSVRCNLYVQGVKLERNQSIGKTIIMYKARKLCLTSGMVSPVTKYTHKIKFILGTKFAPFILSKVMFRGYYPRKTISLGLYH